MMPSVDFSHYLHFVSSPYVSIIWKLPFTLQPSWFNLQWNEMRYPVPSNYMWLVQIYMEKSLHFSSWITYRLTVYHSEEGRFISPSYHYVHQPLSMNVNAPAQQSETHILKELIQDFTSKAADHLFHNEAFKFIPKCDCWIAVRICIDWVL